MTLKARITAVDRFIKGCKEDGIYDDLNAACVMAGWDSLAGALTPLKGAAPTNSGFIATDYDRGGIGITGDGASYLDSGRADNADGQNDYHLAAYVTAAASVPDVASFYAGVGTTSTSSLGRAPSGHYGRCRYDGIDVLTEGIGIFGVTRSSSDEYLTRSAGVNFLTTGASGSPDSSNCHVFQRNHPTSKRPTDGTLAFYSIGSSLGSDPATGLAALDARVSTLMADLRAIEETGFDRDAIAYIRAVEEADGAFLETSVKIAVNNLVSGLKADGLWNAIGSSCLLCGPRTLAGALVPLKGDAPTAYGFVDGDYDRSNGITGDGTSYLDSNRANDADPQDSKHLATYVSSPATGVVYFAGAGAANDTVLRRTSAAIQGRVNRNADAIASAGTQDSTGLIAVSRQSDSLTVLRVNGANESNSFAPNTYVSDDIGIFATISGGSPGTASDATISFYSTGSSLDLATLDSHISSYVTAIGAAL